MPKLKSCNIIELKLLELDEFKRCKMFYNQKDGLGNMVRYCRFVIRAAERYREC